ncbi:MAG: cysteinyl-tRNA synthetase [Candidatus Nanohaloarchaea archaeon]|jgi:cysteinyl-tRNA synthetase
MTLKLFNTLTREKEEFEPIEEGKVKFYSCGQTIYDDLHIGNARPYAVWDTLRRYLEWKGYNVRHVQNITDVGHLTDDGDQGEDKVEKRANELGMEPMELVEDQIERYFEDTEAINVERHDIVPRATGHINEMINYVQKIIDNGFAYEADGNIYFDMEKFVEADFEDVDGEIYRYGRMAKKDIEQLKEEAESRVEPDSKKKNQYDFALWLNAEGTGHLMKWDADFEVDGERIKSTGYPGWHLECSVMGQKYLGEEFDIHAGGKDHIFPHHPNERAQCFAATGEGQARYWLHNEFINIEGEKMSKSEGNFYTVRDLLEDGYSGDAIRLYLISSHYRSETDFSKEGLEKAEKELKRVRRTVKKIGYSENPEGKHSFGEQGEFEGLVGKFEEAMDDDLNTAKAKQVLMSAVSDANEIMDKGEEPAVDYSNALIELFGILGIDVRPQEDEAESEMTDLLLDIREEAREREDYETSDFIRDRLEEIGFEIEDTGDGAKWFKK